MSWVRDPRSWGLLACAGVCASRTLAYLPGRNERLPDGLSKIAGPIFQVWFYGVLWGATGVALVAIALLQRRAERWNALIVGVPVMWGAFWMVSGITNHEKAAVSAGILFWFLAVIFASFVLVTPREPKLPHHKGAA